MINAQMELKKAVDKLIEQLDGTPRKDWGMAIQMSLTGAFEAGHRVGYNSAVREQPLMADSVSANIQEDRALDKGMSDEEKLEEQGWLFVHAIARQLATLGRRYPEIRPGNLQATVFEGLDKNHGLHFNISFKEKEK